MTGNLLSKDERDVTPEPWWDDLDAAVLACLKAKGALAPHEVGRLLGLSESAATSLLCLLAMADKVRICLVEHAPVRSAETDAA
jgi:hypothetical protein